MRYLSEHKVNGLNETIDIAAVDEPGIGGAKSRLRTQPFQSPREGLELPPSTGRPFLRFQQGAINEAGINGLSNEALIAVVLDRLRGFQSGQFAGRDNAMAISHLEDALMRLQRRTRDRIARGVEGQLKP
jgi:hypothetical protein